MKAQFNFSVEPAMFSPSELVTISGLSSEMQRLLRSRHVFREEHLERVGRHHHYSSYLALEIAIRYRLSKLGFIWLKSREIGQEAALAILLLAAQLEDGVVEVITDDESLQPFNLHYYHSDQFVREIIEIGALRSLGEERELEGFENWRFLSSGDGSDWFLARDNPVVGSDSMVTAVINLSAVARNVVYAARKPLLTVRLDDAKGRGAKRILTKALLDEKAAA